MQGQCLGHALETGQDAGVWGGLTAEERSLLRQRRADRRRGQVVGPVIHEFGVRVTFMPCHHQPITVRNGAGLVGCDAPGCTHTWRVRIVDDAKGVYATWTATDGAGPA